MLFMKRGPADGGGETTEYVKSLRNRNLRYVEKRVAEGWKKLPADRGHGWKWVDANGVERIRYMYPDDEAWKLFHEEEGYWRWVNKAGKFLDEWGNVVDESDPLFNQKTHIIIAK